MGRIELCGKVKQEHFAQGCVLRRIRQSSLFQWGRIAHNKKRNENPRE